MELSLSIVRPVNHSLSYYSITAVFFHESLAEQLVKDGIVNGAVNSENSPIIATYSLCPYNMAMERSVILIVTKHMFRKVRHRKIRF